MASKQGADHYHAGAEADALGNVAVAADAAVGNDGLGGYTGTPLERAELPAAGAKAGLELGDADLARAHTDLGRIRAPVFQVDHRLRCGHVAGDHKAAGQVFLEVNDHVAHAVGMTVGDVDSDVLGRQAQRHQLVHRGVVRLLHAQRDGGKQVFGVHLLDELHVVQIKAVHHVKVAIARQPFADGLVHHGFHVGGYYRQAEFAAAQLDAGIAFRTALHPAFAGQQEDVVVVKNFHGSQAPIQSFNTKH